MTKTWILINQKFILVIQEGFNCMKKLSFVFFLLTCWYTSNAQDQVSGYEHLYDLSNGWFYKTNDGFLPFIPENGGFTRSIAFEVNPMRYSENHIRIEAPVSGSVFFNGQLIYNNEDSIHLNLSCDSLALFYDKDIQISIYIPTGVSRQLKTDIVHKKEVLESFMPELGAVPRKEVDHSRYYIVIIFLALTILLLVTSERRTYNELYSFSQISMGRVRDDSIYKLKLFDWPNLGFYLFHCGLLSLLLLLFERFNQIGYSFHYVTGMPFLIRWVLISIIIFLGFIGKYLLIKNLGILYDMKSAANYYFFEYLRMSMVFFGILGILVTILIIRWPDWLHVFSGIGLDAVIIFMIIRFIVIFIRVGKLTPFKNLHLFSYLCTTEILPMVVGINYFLYMS